MDHIVDNISTCSTRPVLLHKTNNYTSASVPFWEHPDPVLLGRLAVTSGAFFSSWLLPSVLCYFILLFYSNLLILYMCWTLGLLINRTNKLTVLRLGLVGSSSSYCIVTITLFLENLGPGNIPWTPLPSSRMHVCLAFQARGAVYGDNDNNTLFCFL